MGMVHAQIRYFVTHENRLLATLGFGAAACSLDTNSILMPPNLVCVLPFGLLGVYTKHFTPSRDG